jgi:hypothetical protein
MFGGKAMDSSFFPLFKELIEIPEFKKLPVISRLYYLLLVSDFNQCGEFHRSDLANAVKLKVSVDTIRRARRQFTKLGWINVKPGFRSSCGRTIATTYQKVKFSEVVNGQLYAKMSRYTFERLLSLRMRDCDSRFPDDKAILTYCYLTFLQTKFNKIDVPRPFFITKRDFAELTGFTEIGETLKQLSAPFFSDTNPLIKLCDEYHKIVVEIIHTIGEAEETRLKDLEELKQRIAKTKNQDGLESVIQLFRELFKNQYARFPGIMEDQQSELGKLVRRYGPKKMQQVVKSFFAAEQLPYFPNGQSRTVGVFMKCYKEFM